MIKPDARKKEDEKIAHPATQLGEPLDRFCPRVQRTASLANTARRSDEDAAGMAS